MPHFKLLQAPGLSALLRGAHCGALYAHSLSRPAHSSALSVIAMGLHNCFYRSLPKQLLLQVMGVLQIPINGIWLCRNTFRALCGPSVIVVLSSLSSKLTVVLDAVGYVPSSSAIRPQEKEMAVLEDAKNYSAMCVCFLRFENNQSAV
ncbi:hypothetical protein NM688_g288 [Phlebia brevispora]|uniref:Uncharacterized protein n=1 Tax=Phlebia brevispora TaxID=194682 RepID=A0ACC1TEN1_9APHY|nr:hypothetical protein NM688_g288 [Phlebia brevispora]